VLVTVDQLMTLLEAHPSHLTVLAIKTGRPRRLFDLIDLTADDGIVWLRIAPRKPGSSRRAEGGDA
jgi:hypothetical protein